jgi:hypothetical protein
VNYVGFLSYRSRKSKAPQACHAATNPAVFTGKQKRFCRLTTRVFETAVIDNEGETLLNGNT